MESKKVVLVAHCIINPNVIEEGWVTCKNALPILNLIVENKVGILQLPCTPFLVYGVNRHIKRYEDYNTYDFRELCKEKAEDVVDQIIEYKKHDYIVVGIIGVANSDNCSVVKRRGIFIEEVFRQLEKRSDINLQAIEIPRDIEDDKIYEETKAEITAFLNRITN